jgi:hypothetical protein
MKTIGTMKTTSFSAMAGMLDRANGKINGVSVLTEGVAKGHGIFIDATTIQQVKGLADAFAGGVKVKTDHGSGVTAIVGKLNNFRIDGEHLRSDLSLIKSHEQYSVIMDLAESQPETFGLSISFSGSVEKIGEQGFARAKELYSVDLVDGPAANPSGLFSIPWEKVQEQFAREYKRLEDLNLPSPVDFKNIVEMPTLAELLPGMFGKDGTITELQTALAESRATLSAAQSEVTQLKKDLADKLSALAAVQTSITTLTAERDAFKATIDKPDGEIEKRAGLKAREIVAKNFGQVTLEVDPSKQAGGDILAEFEAIKDPVARIQFYRKNQAAYDAAFKDRSQQPPKK